MFAWFCGKAATVGATTGSWSLASGGITAPTVQYGGTRLEPGTRPPGSRRPGKWSRSPPPASWSITADHASAAKGAPVTYWAYRAQRAPSTDRALPMRQSASLHLAAGQQHASVRVGYPRFGDTFTITAARPRNAALTGYLEVDGRRMAGFECRSVAHAMCRAGPFEGLERGAASRTWYLHITKRTGAAADVSVAVRFRRH